MDTSHAQELLPFSWASSSAVPDSLWIHQSFLLKEACPIPTKHGVDIIAAIMARPKVAPIWANHMKAEADMILSSGSDSSSQSRESQGQPISSQHRRGVKRG